MQGLDSASTPALLSAALLCILSSACGERPASAPARPTSTPQPQHPIVGVWTLQTMSSRPITADEMQSMTNAVGWMEFRSDNTYTSALTLGSQKVQRGGTYRVSYNSLVFKHDSEPNETHSISLKGDQLVFATAQTGATVVLYSYLKRTNSASQQNE